MDIATDFAGWGWLGHVPRLEILFHSIHYLDTIRAFLGDPTAVFGTQWRRPGQKPAGETRTLSVLLYPGDVRGIVHAGANGDQSAVVCGLDLSAGQIRIAGAATVPSERGGEVRPEKISLKDGVLQVEAWQANQS